MVRNCGRPADARPGQPRHAGARRARGRCRRIGRRLVRAAGRASRSRRGRLGRAGARCRGRAGRPPHGLGVELRRAVRHGDRRVLDRRSQPVRRPAVRPVRARHRPGPLPLRRRRLGLALAAQARARALLVQGRRRHSRHRADGRRCVRPAALAGRVGARDRAWRCWPSRSDGKPGGCGDTDPHRPTRRYWSVRPAMAEEAAVESSSRRRTRGAIAPG